jgi:hypothetical protein
MHTTVVSIISAVPADGWDDIRKFLPGAPNLSPFMALASFVSAFLALVLGFAIVVSIVMLGVSLVKFLTAGGNPQKAAMARDGMKKYAIILVLVGVAWGTIITFIVSAGKSVTS